MIRRYLGLMALLAVLRAAGRLARLAVTGAVLVAAAPVTLVAAGAVTLAWLRGWPPRRLYRAALWCLPMVAVWLAAIAVDHQVLAAGRCGAVPGLARRLASRGRRVTGPGRGGHRPARRSRSGWLAGGLAWSLRMLLDGRRRPAACRRPPRQRSTSASGGTRSAPPGRGSPHPARCRCFRIAETSWPARSSARSGIRPRHARPAPLPAAALAPAGHRRHRDRQDHAAATAVGRLHGAGLQRHAAGRRAAAAARGAGLQGRRGRPADRRPGPPGAARRRGQERGHLARRGQPVAVGPAAGPAHQHAGRPDRARHRRRPPTTPT